MPKDTFYFSHDYNARNDEKILELRASYGAEGYGIFWMIVESMAEGTHGGLKATLIGGLSLGFGIPKHKLLEIISHCITIGLFYEEEGNYYSRRLLTHKEYRKTLSNSGKNGAEKRWGGYSTPNAKESKAKESKVKESHKENEHSPNDIKNSNLFSKPNIPKFEEVHRVFLQNGGTEEMAKTFFDRNESTEWFFKGSPIKNFSTMVSSYISSWNKNDKNRKNGQSNTSHVGKEIEFD